MKKLMAALFTLSAITALANPDSASTTINVRATIQTQSQLVITDDVNNKTIHKAEIDLAHGDINKNDLLANPENNAALTEDKTLYISRNGVEDVLFHVNQTFATIDVSNEDITLTKTDDNTKSILGKLNTTQPVLDTSSKFASFTVSSALDRDSVLAAPAGSYLGQRTIEVIINN